MVSENKVIMRGLSTDTKPTNCGNGARFDEMDTGKSYYYDAANGLWVEWSSSGGGGGGGSDANILVTHPDPDTGILDKTWQEIRDADIAFIKDTVVTEYENSGISCPITATWFQDNVYHLAAVTDNVPLYWDADAADGYPYPVEIEGGE